MSRQETVRDFYDRHPYPPPVSSLDEYRRSWDKHRRRADYHLFWPSRPYREDLAILVAGCGTSQAAKHAMRWPRARVTAIDFSATSVRHTEELKAKYALDNLEVRQLPIERASELERRFDQIVCTGVLHHLADPDAGLARLAGLLEPEGAMHLMVYAPYGRTGVYMLQEFCRRLDIRAADDEIHDLVAALRALPPGHPLETLLRESPDFRDESALADALLHPQDRAYSVPQLLDFIARAGLTFGRWLKQAPYRADCGAVARIPQARRMAQLSTAEQSAAAELFRGTMVRHSVVVYPQGHSQRVGFSGEAWRGYVPIRLPDTICVGERLPPGAAGVLINQTHTYRDLWLPIDVGQRRLFDAIDGVRSAREIVAQTQSRPEMARALFERLWWHDQTVFDTSAHGTAEP